MATTWLWNPKCFKNLAQLKHHLQDAFHQEQRTFDSSFNQTPFLQTYIWQWNTLLRLNYYFFNDNYQEQAVKQLIDFLSPFHRRGENWNKKGSCGIVKSVDCPYHCVQIIIGALGMVSTRFHMVVIQKPMVRLHRVIARNILRKVTDTQGNKKWPDIQLWLWLKAMLNEFGITLC